MKWTMKGHQFDRFSNMISPKAKIYVYGAGENGKDLFARLKFTDSLEAYIDNDEHKQGSTFCGKRVLSLDQFFAMEKEEHIVVIAQSVHNIPLSKNQLLLRGYIEGVNLFDYHSFIQFYLPIFAVYTWNKIYVPTVSMLMTTICNLDCKGCLNFTHDNANKQHYTLERLKEDVDILFSRVDMVGLFHLCGGEPLLFPYFKELIVYVNEKYRDKIADFGTTTNGTIIPSDELCEQMKKAEMTVWVDDYRENVSIANGRYERVLEKLKSFGVKYYENDVDGWLQIQKEIKDEDEALVTRRCTSCNIPFVSLKKHKIYGCNYSDYANEASVIQEEPGDSLDLLQIDKDSKKILLEFVMGYSEKGYYSFCPYCHGSLSINTDRIPVAEQYRK